VAGKNLNTLVSNYKKMLDDGELQATYQSLVGIVQNLRTGFSNRYNEEYTVANVLHGYLDYTYFYLQNDYLKKRKLKFAVVLNHKKAIFELWLLGQTKDVQKQYWDSLSHLKWVDENQMPDYSIFEVPLLDTPDFDNPDLVSASILSTFDSLSERIFSELDASAS